MADRDTNQLYDAMRGEYTGDKAEANGYRNRAFFVREQNTLFKHLDTNASLTLDIACGSGLMLLPWQTGAVVGVDYNEDACQSALQNGQLTLRGDGYKLPFADCTFAQLINCQFLNQQTSQRLLPFLKESSRVLTPGGQFIVMWRNANSLIHRLAHLVLTFTDKLRGRPEFPQFSHPMAAVITTGEACGLEVSKSLYTLSYLNTHTLSATSWLRNFVGASCLVVFQKPEKS